jgi:hypothetical protein
MILRHFAGENSYFSPSLMEPNPLIPRALPSEAPDRSGLSPESGESLPRSAPAVMFIYSLDWLKGKSTGPYGFYMFLPSKKRVFRLKFSFKPIQ